MIRLQFYITILFLCSQGCSTLQTQNPILINNIPHSRDKFENVWINFEDVKNNPQQSLSKVHRYLSEKVKLEGCFIKLPYKYSRYVKLLKNLGYQPYRLNADETVWVYRNGRGIPDQSNTLADARVALLNSDNEVLLIKNRGTNAWSLPGGGIEANELIKAGAVREVREELGKVIETKNLQLVAVANLNFGISDQPTNIVQHFYVHREPVDENIIIDSSEIDDYEWIHIKNLTYEFRCKNIPISKKVVDIAFQFQSKTSRLESSVYPNVPMSIDSFMW